MRQSGIIAAAGLYGIDHHWSSLADDHAHAKRFAELAANIKGVSLVFDKVETNLVFLDVSKTGKAAKAISEGVLGHSVRIGAMGPSLMRAVTHHDVTRKDVEIAAAALEKVIAG